MNASLKIRIFLIDWRLFGHSPLYPTYGTLEFYYRVHVGLIKQKWKIWQWFSV
jgi:hypothetical protein